MISSNHNITDLSIPQRQSPAGIFVEIAFAFQNAMKVLWALVIYLILQVSKVGLFNSFLVLLAIALLVFLMGYLNYRNFLFYIDEDQDEFILRKGIFNKERIGIRFERIQQVNINQSFLQKLINVYEVEIETAGSAKNEAKIRAVSKPIALAIRERLLARKISEAEKSFKPDTIMNRDQEESTPVLKIALSSLVKIALTSDYLKSLGLIIAFFATVYNKLKESVFKDNDMESNFLEYLSSLNLSQYILIITGVIILVVFVFNLIRFTIVYFDFTIRKQGPSLQFSYGLLNTKNTLIQPVKVQVIRIVTNYFQRKLKLQRMFITQASSDVQQDKKATIQLPGFNEEEGKQIIQMLLNAQPVKGYMIKPTIRRIIASVNKFILVPLAIAIVFSWVTGVWTPFLIGMPIYLVVVSVLIYFSYLNNRLFVHDDFIIKKSGVWDISTEIMEPFKIQAITTKQNLWHEKSNVGHVTIHTAGGDLHFKFGDFSTINKYANYWLYQVETSEKEWM